MEGKEDNKLNLRLVLNKLNKIGEEIGNNGKNKLSEEWMDVQDVCIGLKIAKRTLWEYRHKGILPFSRIGGKIYFKVKDIEDFLQCQYKNERTEKDRRNENIGI